MRIGNVDIKTNVALGPMAGVPRRYCIIIKIQKNY